MDPLEHLAGKMGAWVNITGFLYLCHKNDVEVEKGPRDNRTDGEVHYILRRNGSTFDLNTSGYDHRQREWANAVNWIVFNYTEATQ
jgi:hypothetical protein